MRLFYGSYQKDLEDDANLKRCVVSIDIIAQATGFTKEKVEAIN
ncbi:hypothetical protein [Treponema denticola]|nr:hypothetical protein [Treponema denticola]